MRRHRNIGIAKPFSKEDLHRMMRESCQQLRNTAERVRIEVIQGLLGMKGIRASISYHALQKIIKPCLLLLSWLGIFFISYKSHLPSTKTSVTPTEENTISTTPLYPYLIEEPNKCYGVSPFLVLLIPSLPHDAHIRNVLRKTWANESLVEGISIMRIFLLGVSPFNHSQENIRLESSIYHDIIQQDFKDSYNNLTLKTLMGMEWVSRLCPDASYVMKVDSDMFLNPWFLIHQILQPGVPLKVAFFTGLVVIAGVPYRDKGNKWYLAPSIYSKEIYPPYCSGTGYAFSGALARKIYMQTGKFPMVPYEDVHVGICLERIGVQISMPAGNWFIGERVEYNRCEFAKFVTVHRYKPDELLQLWPDFLKAQENCFG